MMPRACSADSADRMPRPIGSISATFNGPAVESLGERLALEQLHGDEQLAVIVTDLVELAHVRMVDAGRGARLAPEPLARRLVSRGRRDRLEGDDAPEPLVARGVDDPHAALAQGAGDDVVPDAGRSLLRAFVRHQATPDLRPAAGIQGNG